LGETEREMVERIQRLTTLGVSIGLFAFTPISGTAMAHQSPPSLGQYRRIQVAHWLIRHKLARADDFSYDKRGMLLNYGLPANRLENALGNGTAFRTSGCPGCNRPYYNERPGGVMYNYPRPLTSEEAARETQALMRQMAC
jgi:biotin synthase